MPFFCPLLSCKPMAPKFRAFLIHLTASGGMALLTMCVVFCLWYPSPLAGAVGVAAITFVLLGVDVVIGPVLTLIVYKPNKPSLRFDLAVIVGLQLAAFGYGVWTLSEGRPVWLVFSVDQFELVQSYQVDLRKISQAKPAFRSLSWIGPQWAAAKRASTPEEKKAILLESLVAGVDIAQRPEQYVPLEDQAADIRRNSRPLEDLSQYNSAQTLRHELKKWPEADAFLPMMARVKPVTVLIHKESAKIIAVVDLNPWL